MWLIIMWLIIIHGVTCTITVDDQFLHLRIMYYHSCFICNNFQNVFLWPVADMGQVQMCLCLNVF